MIKLYKRFFIYFLSLFSLAMCIAYTFFYSTALLNNHLQRYLDLNINQNWGIKKFILNAADTLNDLLPHIESTNIHMSADRPGTLQKVPPLPENIENLIFVNTSEQLATALTNAMPGDGIFIKKGDYRLSAGRIKVGTNTVDNWDKPSLVFAESYGDVAITLNTGEGFYIDKPNWTFQNLNLLGECPGLMPCDHAFHIVGNADNFSLINSVVRNFDSHIKSNGIFNKVTKTREFPDNVKILNNSFFNDYLRMINKPSTPLDIVGGDNWLIKGNFVADFTKALYQHKLNWSYGIFMKGGGRNGVIEENIVACEWRIPHYSKLDARVGISIGGGGTENKFCPEKDCSIEHIDGIVRKNTIVNCTNDSAMYINKGKNILIHDNTILNSQGIELRFPQTSVVMTNNDYKGVLIVRDGAKVTHE